MLSTIEVAGFVTIIIRGQVVKITWSLGHQPMFESVQCKLTSVGLTQV